MPKEPLADFIYLDPDRIMSLAAQLRMAAAPVDRAARERLFMELEPAILGRTGAERIDSTFDFARWVPETFTDGQFVRAAGVVRLLDFAWLTLALGGLPAGRREMGKA